MIRFATALFALSLPLLAQDPAAAPTENLFYKAYWLEKGERDFPAAMALYEQFLAKAPEHKLAKEAARQQYDLLNRSGKNKEAVEFAAKWEKVLGKTPIATGGGDAPRGGGTGAGDAPRAGGRGEGRPEGGRGEGAAGRGNVQERIAAAEKELADAKAAGDADKVKTIEERLARMKQMAERGAGAGGRGEGGGPGGGQGGGRRGGMLPTKKLAEMTPEELDGFKERMGMMEGMMERMRERLTEEQVKVIDETYPLLKKALEENKLEDAQKAVDKLREVMPTGRRGGGGGEASAPPAGGGGGREGGGGGGRGGNNGGGGGGGR
ncbi:MAG: hypothetical protein IPK26_17165 [Planctomycetes bacterium]|nr:hypothetical protein [Planctomycetota bacterium]